MDSTKQEAEWLNRWMQIMRRDLNNSQLRLGDCLRVQDDAYEAEYWRGCIDTTQHLLGLMEAAKNV
jgi:hypothetical protein